MKTTSEARGGGRVQHVQEMRRNASSRFREHAMNPPPIVVTEPVSNAAATKQKARPPPVHARTFPAMRMPSIASASVINMSPPNRSLPSRNTGYLHPFSAFERRFSLNGSTGSPYQRSFPASPVGRSMASSRGGGRPLELQLDTRCHDIDYNYIEIAMEVAEETARICDSPLPIPTDVPLVHSGLSYQTADDLNTWLMIRFNYTGHTRSLLDERWTPEFLARDIIQRSPDFGVSSQRSGVIPISLGSPCKTPALSVPEEASQMSSPEHIVARSPLREAPPRRARMKKDLTIRLTESPVNTRFPHTPLRSSTSPAPTPSVHARRATKAPTAEHDVGSPEPRSGKKAGFVVGLLAMGALLGSPSPTTPFDAPPHRTARLGVSPAPLDLPHTPYSASGFGGWYGVPRDTPSSAAHFISPGELYGYGNSGEEYAWFAQGLAKERR